MITHKALVGKCDKFMEGLGWERSNLSGLPLLPDRVYVRADRWAAADIPLVFEMKPSNIKERELATGIGQLSFFLPYQVKPYLCIPETWAKFGKAVWTHVGVGVVSYDGDLKIFHKAPERDWSNLLPVTPESTRITQYMVAKFIEGKPEGDYSLANLCQELTMEYPEYVVSRGWVAQILKQLGHMRISEALLTNEQVGAYYRLIVGKSEGGNKAGSKTIVSKIGGLPPRMGMSR